MFMYIRVAAVWTFSHQYARVNTGINGINFETIGQPPSSPSTLLSHSVRAAGSAPILGVL